VVEAMKNHKASTNNRKGARKDINCNSTFSKKEGERKKSTKLTMNHKMGLKSLLEPTTVKKISTTKAPSEKVIKEPGP